MYARQLHIFSFNDTATTEIYTLSLHDALPIFVRNLPRNPSSSGTTNRLEMLARTFLSRPALHPDTAPEHLEISLGDRKSTRLNSSHVEISYAVFCLKKKKHHQRRSSACLYYLQ